jgi:hypothetical protein
MGLGLALREHSQANAPVKFASFTFSENPGVSAAFD